MSNNSENSTLYHPAYTVTNAVNFVSIKLNTKDPRYQQWREMFRKLCLNHSVLGYIDGTTKPKDANDATWFRIDAIVGTWFFATIHQDLLYDVLKIGATSKEIWDAIESLFRDNKISRALHLKKQLPNFRKGNLSISEYCQKLKSFSDALADVDQPITDQDLVLQTFHGLPESYTSIVNIIQYKSPFPSFNEARSMLLLDETRQLRHNPSHIHDSSTLFVVQNNSYNSPNSYYQHNGRKGRGKWKGNYGRGSVRGAPHPSHGILGSAPNPFFNSQLTNTNNNYFQPNRSFVSHPMAAAQCAARSPLAQMHKSIPNNHHWASIPHTPQAQLTFSPSPHIQKVGFNQHAPHGPTATLGLYSHATHAHQPPAAQLGLSSSTAHFQPSQQVMNPYLPHQILGFQPTSATPAQQQSTYFSDLFSTMTLQQPNADWYMDTGASSHMASSPGSSNRDPNSSM